MVRLRPVWMTNHPPSVLWHCWLGHQTCKNRRPYNLYCVGAQSIIDWHSAVCFRNAVLCCVKCRHEWLWLVRDWQVVEDGYEFFAKRQLVTLFSAPNYCGEFDNAGAMMSVDETLMCSFQVLRRHCTLTTCPANCHPGFPLFHWKKIQDFPGPPWEIFQDLFGAQEGMLKYKKEKHLLLTTFGV